MYVQIAKPDYNDVKSRLRFEGSLKCRWYSCRYRARRDGRFSTTKSIADRRTQKYTITVIWHQNVSKIIGRLLFKTHTFATTVSSSEYNILLSGCVVITYNSIMSSTLVVERIQLTTIPAIRLIISSRHVHTANKLKFIKVGTNNMIL